MVSQDKKQHIAVIGDEELTLGFKLAGIQKTFTSENYKEKIQELIDRDDIGILIAEQKDLEELPERIRNTVEESVDPVVVALSEEGATSQINDKIKKVIGADIT